MRKPLTFYLKRAWFLVWLLAFVVYRLEALSGMTLDDPNGLTVWLGYSLLILTFPCCFLYALALEYLFNSFGASIVSDNEPLFWLGLVGIGYLQWFWLTPKLFSLRRITTLNLNAHKNPTPCDVDGIHAKSDTHAALAGHDEALAAQDKIPDAYSTRPLAATPTPTIAATPTLALPATEARAALPVQFDEMGRTPVERVFEYAAREDDVEERARGARLFKARAGAGC